MKEDDIQRIRKTTHDIKNFFGVVLKTTSNQKTTYKDVNLASETSLRSGKPYDDRQAFVTNTGSGGQTAGGPPGLSPVGMTHTPTKPLDWVGLRVPEKVLGTSARIISWVKMS